MKTWFEKKFNSLKWWEYRLKLVAKSFGLELSLYSIMLASSKYVREKFGNWRFSDPWMKHLYWVEKTSIDVGARL